MAREQEGRVSEHAPVEAVVQLTSVRRRRLNEKILEEAHLFICFFIFFFRIR